VCVPAPTLNPPDLVQNRARLWLTLHYGSPVAGSDSKGLCGGNGWMKQTDRTTWNMEIVGIDGIWTQAATFHFLSVSLCPSSSPFAAACVLSMPLLAAKWPLKSSYGLVSTVSSPNRVQGRPLAKNLFFSF